MKKELTDIIKMAEGGAVTIERLRFPEQGLAIEGEFELPPLAQLSPEDQIFVAAFVRCHGSIKEMERYFGVSYPTIKSRLRKLSDQLDFVDVRTEASNSLDTLERLERGEISAEEALEELK